MTEKALPITPSVPKRLLLGPGPSEVNPEVLRSLVLPPLGHLDPVLLEIMGQIQDLLRRSFGTKNHVTLALSGTVTAGMAAALANSV